MSKPVDLSRILWQVTKPARYTGGEWNATVKDWLGTPVRIALAYPDLYEIGMSNMALPILYDLFNRQPDVLAERAFAPWADMEAVMKANGIPLFGLETGHPLKDFDILGFSLGYELTYTNVLNMLDLAQVPVLSTERDDSHPLVIAGGGCVLNPEPMADFIDLFVIGEGEEVALELLEAFRQGKAEGLSRQQFLERATAIPGIYVPRFYAASYSKGGLLESFKPVAADAPPVVQRRIVSCLPPPVTRPVVPYIEVVHDRGAVEIQRGCSRGCRFCQAGSIYRPVRERSHEEVLQAVDEIIGNCGYDEVSLVSLSSSDYHDIEGLVAGLRERFRHHHLAVSLPSLRADSFSVGLADALAGRRRSGLTLAPEAGSERMLRAINKNLTEDTVLQAAATAFERGWTTLKLYFLIGLPGETVEDVEGIVGMVNRVNALGRRQKGRRPLLRVSVATVVPKPHTPFQWAGQETESQLVIKQDVLKKGLLKRGIKLSWSDPRVSLLEAALSRGDRRLGRVIYRAWRLGSTFDAWNERFNFENWAKAFAESGLDMAFYACRQRPLDELLPWSHIDVGVSSGFLKREYQLALEGKGTPDCRYELCNLCGLQGRQPQCREKALGPAKRSDAGPAVIDTGRRSS